jgi:hypothetical protein
MSQVGFEIMIPVIERAKTVHTLDGVATVIGTEIVVQVKMKSLCLTN